jgi:ABC-2 type transport system permease protein
MKLYLKFLSIHLRSAMQYKVSFLLTTVGQFLTAFSLYLGIYFMFERFHAVEGFAYQEVLLCFSIVLMAFSLAECFFRGFDTFSTMISNGEFDRMLVRPRSELFLVLASRLELTRIGRLAQAVITLAWALPTCGVQWGAVKIAVLLLMILCGVFVFAGLFLLYAGLCFFTTEGLEFMNIFTDGAREFGRYPFSVYGREVLKFLTYAIPLALIQYYPLTYLLGRSQNPIHAFCPLFSLAFLLPCMLLWKLGLRHYRSTGS